MAIVCVFGVAVRTFLLWCSERVFVVRGQVRSVVEERQVWRGNGRGYLNKYMAVLPARRRTWMGHGGRRRGEGTGGRTWMAGVGADVTWNTRPGSEARRAIWEPSTSQSEEGKGKGKGTGRKGSSPTIRSSNAGDGAAAEMRAGQRAP